MLLLAAVCKQLGFEKSATVILKLGDVNSQDIVNLLKLLNLKDLLKH